MKIELYMIRIKLCWFHIYKNRNDTYRLISMKDSDVFCSKSGLHIAKIQ